MSLSDDPTPTPPLEEVIRAGVREGLLGVNVCMPGIVQTWDPATCSVSVQPALMRLYEGDTVPTQLPVIPRVPVLFPAGGTFRMKWNMAAGDNVTLVFSQRSLDIWKSKGGIVYPEDPRRFNLSDAYAIPGGRPLVTPIVDGASGQTVLVGGSAQIVMLDSGKFRITNGTNELIDVLDQIVTKLIALCNDLSTDTTNTQIGPQALNGASNYSALKSDITALQTKLETLKG